MLSYNRTLIRNNDFSLLIKTLRVEPEPCTCRSCIRRPNPELRSTNRDTKIFCWLVFEWVTPSGSHFKCQNPDLKSTIARYKKNCLRSTQPDSLRKSNKQVRKSGKVVNKRDTKKIFFRSTQSDILQRSSK